MRTAKLDAKRRLTMPANFAPGDAVSIQALDSDNWLIKRVRPDRKFKVVVIPTIRQLADDPAWEKVEKKLALAALRILPEPE